jgi:16S rRNA (uracil1498-N3)-methyltransferase
MDLIVQKAVEIGAAEIAPLISERAIVHLEAKEAAQKQAKWQQVAIEAAKQCGQNWLPTVQLPKAPRDFFLTVEAGASAAQDFGTHPTSALGGPPQNRGLDLRLIGSLQSDAVHLKTILADYEREHHTRPASVLMCIGPEGDFTPAELNLARSNGCNPITLGPIILRVETAAIYCLSVLSYELLATPHRHPSS